MDQAAFTHRVTISLQRPREQLWPSRQSIASLLQVFADQRYQRHDKRDKLPGWITSHLKDAHLNLSTDMLMHVAREFMRGMAQPYNRMQIGKSLLTEEQANAMDVSQL